MLKPLLGLSRFLHHRLKRLPFLLLKLNQALNLRVREVQEDFQIRRLWIGGRVLGEQDGSRQERQEESRDQNGLLFYASFISRLSEAEYMTSKAFLLGAHVQQRREVTVGHLLALQSRRTAPPS